MSVSVTVNETTRAVSVTVSNGRGPAGQSGASTWDDITGTATAIPFEPTTAPAHAEGKVFYDSTDKSLAYYNDEADVSMNIGREMWVRVRNNSGATITNGKVVYLSGATGQLPTIALARADSATTSRVIGVATHDIENNSNGYVTSMGEVKGLNTSAFSDGAILYLSAATAGELTATAPSAPNRIIQVATVEHAHVSQGKLFVHPETDSVASTGIVDGTSLPTSNRAAVRDASGRCYFSEVGTLTSGAGMNLGSDRLTYFGGDPYSGVALVFPQSLDGEAITLPAATGTIALTSDINNANIVTAIGTNPAAVRAAVNVQGIREVPAMTKATWSRYTNSSSGILSMTSRRRVVAICAAKDLKLVFQNSSGESNGYSDITVKAAVEDDAGNIFPVTFSGSRTATVSATGALTTSDPVSGLTTVKGRSYFLRTFSSWASGNVYLNGVVDNSTQTGEGRIDSADRADSGTITATTNYAYVPNMVLGTPIAHNPFETYVFLGDSNMDLLNQGGFQSWEDNWTVSSLGTDHGRNFPYIRLSLGGSQVQVVNAVGSTRRRQFFPYGSVFVILLGTNDVRAHPTTPTSGATVLANLQTLARELLTGGAKEVWVCTLPPDTSASNQNAIRVALNDLLRAEPNPFRGVIDLADAMETSRNSNTWISGYNQADNYHMSNTGGAVARQLIRDTLLRSR